MFQLILEFSATAHDINEIYLSSLSEKHMFGKNLAEDNNADIIAYLFSKKKLNVENCWCIT